MRDGSIKKITNTEISEFYFIFKKNAFMNGQFDDQIDDQFDRSFATAINRTYSRENILNVLKYENGTSIRGTYLAFGTKYLELTEISIAEKEAIHLDENLVNHGRNFFRWFSSGFFDCESGDSEKCSLFIW